METLSIVLGIVGIGACIWIFVKGFVIEEIKRKKRYTERERLSKEIKREDLSQVEKLKLMEDLMNVKPPNLKKGRFPFILFLIVSACLMGCGNNRNRNNDRYWQEITYWGDTQQIKYISEYNSHGKRGMQIWYHKNGKKSAEVFYDKRGYMLFFNNWDEEGNLLQSGGDFDRISGDESVKQKQKNKINNKKKVNIKNKVIVK